MDDSAEVFIEAEERGRKENDALIAHYNMVMDRGTYYVKSEKFKERIVGFSFFNKKDNHPGLQLADLTAYPLAQHILYPERPYIPFDIIKNKIYCNAKGKRDGWGLKVFP